MARQSPLLSLSHIDVLKDLGWPPKVQSRCLPKVPLWKVGLHAAPPPPALSGIGRGLKRLPSVTWAVTFHRQVVN